MCRHSSSAKGGKYEPKVRGRSDAASELGRGGGSEARRRRSERPEERFMSFYFLLGNLLERPRGGGVEQSVERQQVYVG